jgi:hypothetical protein
VKRKEKTDEVPEPEASVSPGSIEGAEVSSVLNGETKEPPSGHARKAKGELETSASESLGRRSGARLLR